MGAPLAESHIQDRYVLFPCGGAMLIRRKVFLEAGGFDEDYFAFFEDADLGWRLWVLGYTVKYAGQAVVYHHHHGSWRQVSERYRQKLYERNTLATILKNYEDGTLQQVLPAALFLMGYRAFLTSGLDANLYRPPGPDVLSRAPGPYRWLRNALAFYGPRAWTTLWQEGPKALIHKSFNEIKRRRQTRQLGQANRPGRQAMLATNGQQGVAPLLPDRTLAYFEAAQSILEDYDRLMEKRQFIQAARKRPDREIFPLFRTPLVPNYPDDEHFRALQVVSDLWSLYDLFA
ncbi:MAG: glycosyltransferase family 2 protein [candidate division WOR-3 bacterium]